MSGIRRLPSERTKQISSNVKEMRLQLGYSKNELGKVCGVSGMTVKNWEDVETSNEPTASQYEMLLEVYKREVSGAGFTRFTTAYLNSLLSQLSTVTKQDIIKFLSDSIKKG